MAGATGRTFTVAFTAPACHWTFARLRDDDHLARLVGWSATKPACIFEWVIVQFAARGSAAIEHRRPSRDLADRRLSSHPPPAPNPVPLRIIDEPVTRRQLSSLAPELGDMIKAVVDVERGVMAIGGEMHADAEAALLDDGSRQADLWGINLYPAEAGLEWLEFDSMINVRPSRGNRSRDVEDPVVREAIRQLVTSLVRDA